MMNALDRDEEFGDGYRNEFQRAMAVSQMEPCNDDRRKIAEAVAAGKFVAVSLAPRHCRYTDAVIGEYQHILAIEDDRADAEQAISNLLAQHPGYSDDCHYQVLPHFRPSAPAPAPIDPSDDVPF